MSLKTKLKGKTVSFVITAAIAIFTGAALFIIIYFVFPSIREHLIFVAGVTGGAAAIYTAYYAGIQVKLMYELERRHRAFEIVHRLDEMELLEQHRTLVDNLDPRSMSQKEVFEKVRADPKLNSIAMLILNFLEDVSLAIQEDYADEDVLYKLLNYLVISTHRELIGFINEFRKEKDHRTLFLQFERLATAWREEKSIIDKRKLSHDL